jgi:hypothetical protein
MTSCPPKFLCVNATEVMGPQVIVPPSHTRASREAASRQIAFH